MDFKSINYTEAGKQGAITVGAGFGGFTAGHIVNKLLNKDNKPMITWGMAILGLAGAGLSIAMNKPMYVTALAAGVGIYGVSKGVYDVVNEPSVGTSGIGFLPESLKSTLKEWVAPVGVSGPGMGNLPGYEFNADQDPLFSSLMGNGIMQQATQQWKQINQGNPKPGIAPIPGGVQKMQNIDPSYRLICQQMSGMGNPDDGNVSQLL
ncbi:MAG: hypothetical protein F9K23_15850 [Bacteroidetes bacterium]|nr:MAG: hypothetical protein F9K23_15850 [Bacteroidota bacterium]